MGRVAEPGRFANWIAPPVILLRAMVLAKIRRDPKLILEPDPYQTTALDDHIARSER
jgi:hypothetical protein